MHLRSRSLAGRNVVVVGATSGVGRATALLLARQGARLLIAARSTDELAAVAAECRVLGALAVSTCAVDIGDGLDVARLERVVRAELVVVDVWVNCAAVLVVGDLTVTLVEELDRIVATNVLGTAMLTRVALIVFDEQRHGTLINVSSLLGLVQNPVVPAYCMTKFAIRGLTTTLQRSRRPGAIDICLVMPGPVDTPVFTNAANHTGRRLRSIPPAGSPWRIAAAIVRCARRPRRTVTVGVTGWILLIGHRVTPRLAEWVVARWSGALVTTSETAPGTSGNLFGPLDSGAVDGGFRRGRLRVRLGDAMGRWAGTRSAS
jgi:short-subunit dehydrogenase